MKDSSSWIYVLIMIAMAVIGSRGKSKKAKELQRTQPINPEVQNTPPPTHLDSLKPIKAVTNKSKKPVSFLTNELENSIMAPIMTVDATPVSDDVQQTTVSFDTPADARKAFIYSEIFSRKY